MPGGLARADYLLSSGDVLEITVFRIPELSREVRVDVDGRVAYPPLGRLDVRGQGVDALAELIRTRLAAEEILSDPQVTVALTATRPVFIGGDVAAPGAYPYQAGLTARRAITLAGGLGFARARGRDEVSALRGERDTAAIDLLRDQARLARIGAETAGSETFVPPAPEPGVAPARRDEILGLEADALRANLAEAAAAKAHLDRELALVRDRIDTLGRQRDLQDRLTARQIEEIARIRGIQDRGLASVARVSEEQRILDSILQRAAENETDMALARESLESAQYELDRFDARRAAALGQERQEAVLAVETGRARLRALETRLAELGASDAGRLTLVLHRDGAEAPDGAPVDQDTLLGPGDTLDIVFDAPEPDSPDELARARP
ncbi:MAG: hypothetical protein DI556_06550 [Rhodovulum sulfidophilum]|uniref:Polysaccharide export protein N-terminal domain-containing protein n=1 Tax=Rhodovulum sulfidophilum TaxID=35806 RepID=A0A2W5Q7T8_RHOSU|nr:MAG: hypothetical protein DI556_06550 [Rhodovulum sulfidophilum]